LEINLNFISKNPFEISSLESKVQTNFQEGLEGTFSMTFSQTSSLNFVHKFFLEAQNYKWVFGNEISLDLTIFLRSNFISKRYSTMLK